jgi:hypothetical protein
MKHLITKTKTFQMKKSLLSPAGVSFLLLSLVVFLSVGCQRDLDDPAGGDSANPVNDNEMVTGSVTGIVVDENNRPVVGAAVASGASTTTTDRYGSFSFTNISLSKTNGKVKVTRAGYFTGYRTFVSVAGRNNNVRIKLIPKTNAGNFAGSAGGTINITGGGKLVVPAAAVTDASGNAYTGSVDVAMTWIDPTSADLPNIVPGDLRGIITNGEERGLSTYGMLGVEMTGAGGQSLKIATGKTAELTFPIPATLQGSAPATIDLWHFDEATARWKQEGTATKTGSNYVAQVSHFSFWNCDAPFPLIDLCMTLVNPNNQPLNNVQVRIKRTVNNTYGYGRTDQAGNLCGKVPKDEALVLEVVDQCNAVIYSQNTGPFSANTSLGNITVTIPASNNLIITGTVTNCAGANVTNGAAVIYMEGGNYYSVPVTNGTFSLNLLRCNGGAVNFSVLGVDYTALQQSAPVSGTGTTGTVNAGTLQACGTSAVQFIEFLVDGTPVSFAAPPDDITSIDSVATGVFSNTTSVFSSRGNAGTNIFSRFIFSNNTVAATGLPLTSIFIAGGTGLSSQQVVTVGPTVNVTTYGPVTTGFIEGNFNIQMNFSGTTKNVICTFRVRRG